jgi:hypothetical protein
MSNGLTILKISPSPAQIKAGLYFPAGISPTLTKLGRLIPLVYDCVEFHDDTFIVLEWRHFFIPMSSGLKILKISPSQK